MYYIPLYITLPFLLCICTHVFTGDPNRPTLQQLNNNVKFQAASQWYDLGLELLSAENSEKISIISHDYPKDAATCCTEMFSVWLHTDTTASWAKLVNALRAPSVGLDALAAEINKKFLNGRDCEQIAILLTCCPNCRSKLQ